MIRPHNFPVGVWVEHRDNGSEGVVVEHTETKCIVEFTDGILRGRTIPVQPFSLDRVRGQRYQHDTSAASPKAEPQPRLTFTSRQYELKGAAIEYLRSRQELERGVASPKAELSHSVIVRNTRARLVEATPDDVMMLATMLVLCEITRRVRATTAQREPWIWFQRARVTPEVPGSIFRDGIASLYRKAA